MGPEPTKELLRMRDIVAWTGLSENQIRTVEKAGTLVGKPLFDGGRRFYQREHVRTVFFKDR